MKTISFRLPDELAEWLRERAAHETIKRKKYVSINVLVAEIFRHEMEADAAKQKSLAGHECQGYG
ncbi:MAG: hypothetical protein ABSF52_06575 [Syntrophobacteraceae bacterium]|jgi:predicted DNA-binding protein